MRHQAQSQEQRAQPSHEFSSRIEETNIQGKAQEIGKRRQNGEHMIHSSYPSPRLILLRVVLPLALQRGTHLVPKHLEYSPHSQWLAQFEAPRAVSARLARICYP